MAATMRMSVAAPRAAPAGGKFMGNRAVLHRRHVMNQARPCRVSRALVIENSKHYPGKHVVLGVDIGGTGCKAAPVNILTGEVLAERRRIETPQPATPEAICATVGKLVSQFDWDGPIGCGFPAAVRHGKVCTAANIDKSWIGQDIHVLLRQYTGAERVSVVNDADAAGAAEMRFGAGRGVSGNVMMVTIGTGLGTALFTGGHLVPNTELGHLFLSNAREGEEFAANSAREREKLGWGKWGKRLNKYLCEIDKLFWPDLIILGGGVSKKSDKWLQHIDLPNSEVKIAEMRNFAGIVGAAVGGFPDLVDLAVEEAGGQAVVLRMLAEREATVQVGSFNVDEDEDSLDSGDEITFSFEEN